MFYKLYFLVGFLCWQLVIHAQKKSFVWQGSVQTGLLEGNAGNAIQLAATGGIQYKTLSVAIGTGLDYYYIRSLPVFIELRKNLGVRANSFFLYADGGYNFAWPQQPKGIYDFSPIPETTGGLYLDAGIGYQLAAFKNTKLFFSTGYTEKHITTKENQNIYILDVYPPPVNYTMYTSKYILRRMSFKMGLRF